MFYVFQSQIFQIDIKSLPEQTSLDAREGKEERKVDAEEDVEAVPVEVTELASEEMILEGSEGDAEVVFKEVNEVLSGEGSLHVIPGIFSC